MTAIHASVAIAVHVLAVPAAAQALRQMEFVSGSAQNDLVVKVRYEDPSDAAPLLRGSRVLPFQFEVRNASPRAVRFEYRDLRLNLGGDAPLPAAEPAAALREIRRTKRVPKLLGVLGARSSAFHPQALKAWLEKQRLVDGALAPGQTKSGLVFFICPEGATPAAASGVAWLEQAGRRAQMLETKDLTVWTKAPQQPGFTARLRQAWDRYFSAAPPAFNRSYALLIGIGSYRHLDALQSPAQDVRKMAEYLAAQGFDEIVTITDESVTPESFGQPQKYFKSKVERDDRFVFYYSGHGMTVLEKGRPRGYFPLADEVAGGTRRSIAMDSVVAWTKALASQHLLVILDSCFSGLAVEGTEVKASGPTDPGVDRDTLNRIARGPARYLIMAGTAGQKSFGGREWNGSVFTDTLLRGLRSGADVHRNRIVTARALYVWVKEAVYLEAKKAKRELTPLFLDLGPNGVSAGEFIFIQ
jgi:hypothetical protein